MVNERIGQLLEAPDIKRPGKDKKNYQMPFRISNFTEALEYIKTLFRGNFDGVKSVQKELTSPNEKVIREILEFYKELPMENDFVKRIKIRLSPEPKVGVDHPNRGQVVVNVEISVHPPKFDKNGNRLESKPTNGHLPIIDSSDWQKIANDLNNILPPVLEKK